MTRPLALRAGSVARGPLAPCCCASRLCSRSISSSRARVAGGTSEPCFRSHSAHLGRRSSAMWPRQRTREAKKVPQAGQTELGTNLRNSDRAPCLLRLWLARARADGNMALQPLHANARTRPVWRGAVGAGCGSRTDSEKCRDRTARAQEDSSAMKSCHAVGFCRKGPSD